MPHTPKRRSRNSVTNIHNDEEKRRRKRRRGPVIRQRGERKRHD